MKTADKKAPAAKGYIIFDCKKQWKHCREQINTKKKSSSEFINILLKCNPLVTTSVFASKVKMYYYFVA